MKTRILPLALALSLVMVGLAQANGGGEPTFSWKTMRSLVAYAKEKPIPTKFSLTSNGSSHAAIALVTGRAPGAACPELFPLILKAIWNTASTVS